MGRVTGKDDNYHEYRTPPSLWQTSHIMDPDEFETTSITSNGSNQPPDTSEFATAPMNTSIHGGTLLSSETKWRTRRVADIEDDDHEYKTIPTSQWSGITSPSTCNGRSHHTPECRNIEDQGPSRDNLRVSTVTSTFLPIEWSAPISVCVYTYSSSILEEAQLQKHSTANLRLLIPTEEDLSTHEALLLPWTSAQAECTDIDDTLGLTHSYGHERPNKRSAPTEKTPYDWRTWGWDAFPGLKWTYSANPLRSVKRIVGQTQFRRLTTTTTMTTMTTQSASIMDIWTSPNIWMIFDCNYIDDKGSNQQSKRHRSLDTQQVKTIGGTGTNGDSGRKWMARCNTYGHLSTAAQPASLSHRGFSRD